MVLFNIKIKRAELRKYITKNKKILETLHFDIKPYANGMQKWKTLYSPKVTGKTEDEGSVGMVPLLENDNVLKHVVQIDDNDLAVFDRFRSNRTEHLELVLEPTWV